MKLLSTALAVLVVLGALAACGGSSGGGDSQPPTSGTIDPEVSQAASSVLAASQAPDQAIQNYLDTVYLKLRGSDLSQTLSGVQSSGLAAIKSQQDFENLLAAIQNAGLIHEIAVPSGPTTSALTLCPTSEQETILYYVNGIFTTPMAACEGLAAIRTAVESVDSIVAADLRFKLFYNKSGIESTTLQNICNFVGLPYSLLDADPISLYGPIVGVVLYPLYLAQLALVEICIELFGISGDLIESAQQYLEQVGLPVAPPEDVAKLAVALTQDVQSGKRVIVVAHSQGNYFTQQAIAQMPTDSFGPTSNAVGVIALASPASHPGSTAYGEFRHFTLAQDIITKVPGSLPANMSNALTESITNPACPVCSDSVIVHGLTSGYLAFAASRLPIASAIVDNHATLENPRESAGQGFLQATLTWNIPGDIDLHVFEPTGTHVYWANKQGDVGELDKDDIPGTGPENYFVCTEAEMLDGSYSVLVNNYDGATGTLASIAIKAGALIEQFQVVVNAPNQGTTLIPVATVVYEDGAFLIIPN